MDTGTFESMKEASEFIYAIQRRQGMLLGSPELAAYRNKWINKKEIIKNLSYSNDYTKALIALLR